MSGNHEQDRLELGRRAAAHIREENKPWTRRAKITELLKRVNPRSRGGRRRG